MWFTKIEGTRVRNRTAVATILPHGPNVVAVFPERVQRGILPRS
jgi:hypothetical protein